MTTNRLPTQTLVIPDIRTQAADIAIDAVREAGLDPLRAARNRMAQACIAEWGAGRLTREQFIHSLRNLLILNPSLAAGGRL